MHRWWIDLDADHSANLEIRNDKDRPRLYYSLARNGKGVDQDSGTIYEVPDDQNWFGGVFSLFGENDEEYDIEITAT